MCSSDLRKQLNYSPLLALSYNSFGRLEELKKNHQKAEMYYKKSLVLWEQVNNTQFRGCDIIFDLNTNRVTAGYSECGENIQITIVVD